MATKKTTKKAAPSNKNAGKRVNTAKTEEDFPGYPKYSADEDITRRATRVDENLDDEVLTQVKHNKNPKITPDEGQADLADSPENAGTGKKSDFEVNEEDLEALGPK